MKASEVKKLVMNAKSAVIMTDRDGRQWLGDGRYFFAADDSLPLNEDNVLAVLDVDKDKRDKIRCTQAAAFDPRMTIMPDEEHDVKLTPRMSVYYGDEMITIMTSDDNELFGVRQSAIRPANAKYGLAFFARRREGMIPWIMCFEDMFATAILMPGPARAIAAIVEGMQDIMPYKIVSYETREDAEEA